MKKTVSLCKDCAQCPAVEVTDTHIRIGEEGNLCTLKPKEWETLRQKILAGEL